MTRTLNLDALTLERGAHSPPNGDAAFCVMEAVAYIAGEIQQSALLLIERMIEVGRGEVAA